MTPTTAATPRVRRTLDSHPRRSTLRRRHNGRRGAVRLRASAQARSARLRCSAAALQCPASHAPVPIRETDESDPVTADGGSWSWPARWQAHSQSALCLCPVELNVLIRMPRQWRRGCASTPPFQDMARLCGCTPPALYYLLCGVPTSSPVPPATSSDAARLPAALSQENPRNRTHADRSPTSSGRHDRHPRAGRSRTCCVRRWRSGHGWPPPSQRMTAH